MKQRYYPEGRRKKVNLDFLLRFYDAYLRENNIAKVASALGIVGSTLQLKIDSSKSLQKAQKLADELRTQNILSHYVLRNLSSEAQLTWKKLTQAKSLETINEIFKGKPIRLKQELFIHALTHSAFDLTSACRMIGINRNTVENWRHDLEFLQLLEEVQFHKKNFFESRLIGLVAEGHPQAVIFVNRTINADRGYNEKLTLETANQTPNTGFNIDELNLDIDTRRKILQAIQKKKSQIEPSQLPAYSNGNNGHAAIPV